MNDGCMMHGCKNSGWIKITYGLYEYNSRRIAILCQDHSQELWNKCNILVSQGLMHWENEKP